MQRLIDKRCAIKHLKELLKNSIMPTEWYEGAKSAITLLQKEPTVDAVPVVRCKECNCFERNNTKKGEVLYCYYHEMNIKEDDFCAWGERKEDETGNTYSIGKIELPKGVFRQIYDEERREDAE